MWRTRTARVAVGGGARRRPAARGGRTPPPPSRPGPWCATATFWTRSRYGLNAASKSALSWPTVPSCSFARLAVDGVLVHVDQDAGPVGGGLHGAGAVAKFVGVVAVLRPDQGGERDRGDRDHPEDSGADAVAGDGGAVVAEVRLWLVVGHAREGTRRFQRTGDHGVDAAPLLGRPDLLLHISHLAPWWGDGRSHPLGYRPEPRRLRCPPPGRPVRPCQRPLVDRVRDARRPRHRRRVPVAVRPRRGAGPRPDHRSRYGGDIGRRGRTFHRHRRAAHRRSVRQLHGRADGGRARCTATAGRAGHHRRCGHPRGAGRGAGRPAAHRRRRRRGDLRRHRLQGLHAATWCT